MKNIKSWGGSACERDEAQLNFAHLPIACSTFRQPLNTVKNIYLKNSC